MTSEEWHRMNHKITRTRSSEVKKVLSGKQQLVSSLERDFTPISENSMSSIEAEESKNPKEIVASNNNISNASSLAESENVDETLQQKEINSLTVDSVLVTNEALEDSLIEDAIDIISATTPLD